MAAAVPVLSEEDLLFHHLTRYGALTIDAEPMSDEDFLAFCERFGDLPVESTAEGSIVMLPPAGADTGYQNSGLIAQVWPWVQRTRRGRSFDSNTMFVLPNGARRAPDCSFVSNDRIEALGDARSRTLWPVCPDFVIELRSKTDRRRRLEAKMEEYLANGARLGWLIDPRERTVTVYRPRRKPEVLVVPKVMEGEGPVAGLKVRMRPLWEN